MDSNLFAPSYWVSDQGSHFINELMESLAKDYNVVHKPTIAYSPWLNGTVERLNRDILSALLAIIAELDHVPQDWPSVLDSVASALNEAPLPRLGTNVDGTTRTPLEVITGIRPRRSLLRITCDNNPSMTVKTMEHACAEQITRIDKLHVSLNELHRDVKDRVDKRRQKAMDKHNISTNIFEPRF